MNVSAITTQTGMFKLLAADQLVAIADRLGLGLPTDQSANNLAHQISTVIHTYAPSCSGIVLASELSELHAREACTEKGVLFPLERRNFDADPLSVPILAQSWGVSAIRNNYGIAKLELFFNPEEKEAASKKQMVAELYDFCQHEGIELVLEVLVYVEGTELEYQNHFPELQLGAVQELRKLCSVMALEYPLNALGAVTITAELDIPWILALRDTPYELAKEQLRTALESGARGFMGIEPFLPDKPAAGITEFNPAQMNQFIETTGRDRVLELSRIVDEATPAYGLQL